jgi:predicted RNA-binding protein YlxR (DUF448 family)
VTPHIPHRQCAGCGRRRPQIELVRVAAVDGRAEIDRGRRLGGRGAYLCPDAACARRAARRGGLTRRLRQPVTGLDDLAAGLPVERSAGAWEDS